MQRLDLSTPIFYCQPNIFNIKRTVRETITKITIARISRLCQHKLHLTSSKQTTKSHVVFAFILPIFYCQTMHHRPNCQFGGHNTSVTSVARISQDFQGPFLLYTYINVQCTIFEKSSLCFIPDSNQPLHCTINTRLWCGSYVAWSWKNIIDSCSIIKYQICQTSNIVSNLNVIQAGQGWQLPNVQIWIELLS